MENNRSWQVIEEARQFVDEHIRPFAAEFEQQAEFPTVLIRQMGKRGYLSASFPEEYGGLGMNALHYGHLVEEMGKGALSAAMLLTVTSGLVGETLLRWGTDYQKEHFVRPISDGSQIASFALSEPAVGSSAKDIETSYEKRGDSYILNGRKKWISFGSIADFFVVIAAEQSTRAISAFMVERNQVGVSTNHITGLLSCDASHIANIELEQVEVPAEHLLGKEGMGFTSIVNSALDYGRYHVAWMGVALAQEALEMMVTYARKRSQFGQKIYNFQLIKGMIGDAVTQVEAARSLCKEAGQLRADKHPDAAMKSTIAKYFASQAANRVAADAVQVFGANGFQKRFCVERLYREAKVLEIIEGSSQIQQQIIASHGLNKHYHPKRITNI